MNTTRTAKMTKMKGLMDARHGLALAASVGVLGLAAVAMTVAPYVRAASGVGVQRTVKHFDLELPPSGVLRVTNAGGRIGVCVWDGEQVQLTITREAAPRGGLLKGIYDWAEGGDSESSALPEPIVRSSAQGAEVTTIDPSDADDLVVSYQIEVKLPRGRGLVASNGNGSITICGVEGDVQAISNNGDLRCNSIAGRVEASVRNGGIYCRNVAGELDMQTSNGAIEIDGVALGQVYAARVFTTNGPIRFHAGAAPSLALNAETDNGRIVNHLALQSGSKGATLRKLEGHRGQGGPEVELHALNGNIYVDPS